MGDILCVAKIESEELKEYDIDLNEDSDDSENYSNDDLFDVVDMIEDETSDSGLEQVNDFSIGRHSERQKWVQKFNVKFYADKKKTKKLGGINLSNSNFNAFYLHFDPQS